MRTRGVEGDFFLSFFLAGQSTKHNKNRRRNEGTNSVACVFFFLFGHSSNFFFRFVHSQRRGLEGEFADVGDEVAGGGGVDEPLEEAAEVVSGVEPSEEGAVALREPEEELDLDDGGAAALAERRDVDLDDEVVAGADVEAPPFVVEGEGAGTGQVRLLVVDEGRQRREAVHHVPHEGPDDEVLSFFSSWLPAPVIVLLLLFRLLQAKKEVGGVVLHLLLVVKKVQVVNGGAAGIITSWRWYLFFDDADLVVGEVADVEGAVAVEGDAADGAEERIRGWAVPGAAFWRAGDGRDEVRRRVEAADTVSVGDEEFVFVGGDVVDDAEAGVQGGSIFQASFAVGARDDSSRAAVDDGVSAVLVVRHRRVDGGAAKGDHRAGPDALVELAHGFGRARGYVDSSDPSVVAVGH
mmetsp:Transcript_23669/g.76013  ORF Transcript_23669/g.76013 Transcript_23669/m.76013 type:complete len:408 (-) Transcript_23669:346-1569(-)